MGQTSADMVEVKSGLFEGDSIVTQRAPQLYAQSLRGGSTAKPNEAHDEAPAPSQATDSNKSGSQLPWWLVIPAGGGVAAIAAGSFWLGRRTKNELVPATAGLAPIPKDSPSGSSHKDYLVFTDNVISADESPKHRNNHHHVISQESDVRSHK